MVSLFLKFLFHFLRFADELPLLLLLVPDDLDVLH